MVWLLKIVGNLVFRNYPYGTFGAFFISDEEFLFEIKEGQFDRF